MLTGTGLLVEAFATLLVEDDDFLTANFYLCDFANNFSAFNDGSAYAYRTIIVDEENLVEGHLVANLSVLQIEDTYLLASLYTKLLTLHLYDCKHFNINKKLKKFLRRAECHTRHSLDEAQIGISGCKDSKFLPNGQTFLQKNAI